MAVTATLLSGLIFFLACASRYVSKTIQEVVVYKALVLIAKVTFTAAVGWVIQIVIRRAIHYFRLKHIAGPSFGSLFSGNFQETFNDCKATVINQWIDRYGKVFRTWAFFGDIELYVADLKGIGHVLKHDSVRYQKPELVLFTMKRLIETGLFTIEGDAHRKQRKVM
ncbi:hypothetical protein PQX77_000818, partial [Marasmius sp. AFHP31]